MAAICEVGMMRCIDRPGDQLAVLENRLRQNDIRQMGAATLIGVVADKHVAGRKTIRAHMLQNIGNKADKRAEMHRDMFGLAKHCPPGVEQCRRAIAAFLDIGGIAGTNERLSHFLDGGGKCAADDLDSYRIECCSSVLCDGCIRHHFPSTMRLR